MTSDEYSDPKKYLRGQSPKWCRFVGHKRLVGMIDIVRLEMDLAETKDVDELRRRIYPKLRQAYGSFWAFILIRIATILIKWWLQRDKT